MRNLEQYSSFYCWCLSRCTFKTLLLIIVHIKFIRKWSIINNGGSSHMSVLINFGWFRADRRCMLKITKSSWKLTTLRMAPTLTSVVHIWTHIYCWYWNLYIRKRYGLLIKNVILCLVIYITTTCNDHSMHDISIHLTDLILV